MELKHGDNHHPHSTDMNSFLFASILTVREKKKIRRSVTLFALARDKRTRITV